MITSPRKTHAEYRLSQEIIARSESEYWTEAKEEWLLVGVYLADEPDRCLCGHSPIRELCHLRNRHNGSEVIVGNVCVKKFLGIDSDGLFNALTRVSKDPTRSLNTETIEHAHEHGWINDWERGFYSDTIRKRKLSPKQRAVRVKLNLQILSRVGR